MKDTRHQNIRFLFVPKEDLSAEVLYQLAGKSYEYGSPWSVESFQQDLLNDHAAYALAVEDKKIIGYLGWHQILDETEVTNLVVDPSFQQKGIASKLLQLCVEKWTAEQAAQAFLEVRRSNHAAIQLYQKIQFVLIGERKKYYTTPQEDALIMQLKLNNTNV